MGEPVFSILHEVEVSTETLNKTAASYIEGKYFKLSIEVIQTMLEPYTINSVEKDLVSKIIPYYKKFYKNNNFKFFDSFIINKAGINDKFMARILVFLFCTPFMHLLFGDTRAPSLDSLEEFLNEDSEPSTLILDRLHTIVMQHIITLNYSNAKTIFKLAKIVKLPMLNLHILPDGIKIRKIKERRIQNLLSNSFVTFLDNPTYERFDAENLLKYTYVLKCVDYPSEDNNNNITVKMTVLTIDHDEKVFLNNNCLNYCELLIEK